MKYIIYVLLAIGLTSCFQCNDTYTVKRNTIDSLLLNISAYAAADDEMELMFSYSLPNDSCSLVIENATFQFVDENDIINYKKEIVNEKDFKRYQSISKIPLEYRNLSKNGGSNVYKMYVIFEEKYRDLENFKMIVKTETKDHCGNVITYINKRNISVENNCHWHFALH